MLGLEQGKECVIVGTLYKHMKLKPSVLDEYSKEVLGSLPIDCVLRIAFLILHVDFVFFKCMIHRGQRAHLYNPAIFCTQTTIWFLKMRVEELNFAGPFFCLLYM